MTPWSPSELLALEQAYAKGRSVRALAKRLNRTPQGCYTQARRLGLEHRGARREWTSAEDLTLQREWGENGWRSLRTKLPGRTRISIVQRAGHLGLPRVPQGWVSLRAASVRCGMKHETLLNVLERAGIRPRRWYALTSTAAGVRLYVDLDAVVMAVEDEVRNWERVLSGARRWELRPGTLLAWLTRAGVEFRSTSRPTAPRYYRTADIDRVVRERGWAPGRVSISVAARAVGLSFDAMRRRMVLAGLLPAVRGGGSADVCVDLDEARRAVAEGRGLVRPVNPPKAPVAPSVGGRRGRVYARPGRVSAPSRVRGAA